MTLAIAPLCEADRAAWEPLARGYKRFYETVLPDSEYDQAWARLMSDARLLGLGAKADGRLVGICHALFHASTWSADTCYLQDLFVAEDQRGRGTARALIAAVAAAATERGAPRLYWLTQAHNSVARALYDKVAVYKGFIRYDHPLPSH
jgi:GNAT superfamily N-acetyltransferase